MGSLRDPLPGFNELKPPRRSGVKKKGTRAG